MLVRTELVFAKQDGSLIILFATQAIAQIRRGCCVRVTRVCYTRGMLAVLSLTVAYEVRGLPQSPGEHTEHASEAMLLLSLDAAALLPGPTSVHSVVLRPHGRREGGRGRGVLRISYKAKYVQNMCAGHCCSAACCRLAAAGRRRRLCPLVLRRDAGVVMFFRNVAPRCPCVS